MTDLDKFRIKPLDDKSDYCLWRIRVTAAISAKGLECVFEKDNEKSSETSAASSSANTKPTSEQCQQASNIIVSALGDHALRVVRSVIGKPQEMIMKLDDRYDSKTIASRISKMSELVSLRYTSIKDDMDKHIDKMAGLIEQLRAMGSIFDDALAIGILVASIDVSELLPATAAIKTLSDKEVKWEDVSSRLIDEAKNLKSGFTNNRSYAANTNCAICGKSNHTTDRCFLNPLNPKNKLKLKSDPKKPVSENQKDNDQDNGNKSNSDQKKKKSKERSALAHTKKIKYPTVDKMMLDSGTTSHLTSNPGKVTNTQIANISIKLADDSTMNGTARGTREVRWVTENGTSKVSLSNTIVVPNAAMSLLSVPSLVNKNIAVMFLPGKAILIDLEDNYSILGYAEQEEDGLFYMDDFQKEVPPSPASLSTSIKSMMAIVKNNTTSLSLIHI